MFNSRRFESCSNQSPTSLKLPKEDKSGWVVWVGVIWKRLKITLWKSGFILRVVDCCERGFIIFYVDGHLVLEFYWVRYQIRLQIRTRSWYVLLLEFSCWPPSGSTLFFCSTVKIWFLLWIEPGGEKKSTWGKPLQNFGCLLQLVKLIKYKKYLSEGTPWKSRLLSSVGLPKEAKNS